MKCFGKNFARYIPNMSHCIDPTRIVYATSTVQDGNMSYRFGSENEVTQNRSTFLLKHGLNGFGVTEMKTEHSDAVVVLRELPYSKGLHVVAGEALLTDIPGHTLLLLTADCLPVVCVDVQHGALALAHLGRKPSEMHLAKKVVEAMAKEYGTNPYELCVVVGPSIKKESYFFDSINEIHEKVPSLYGVTAHGHVCIDLEGFNRQEFKDSEIKAENMYFSPIDTAMSKDYFSHRRAVQTGETEGRFLTLVGIR